MEEKTKEEILKERERWYSFPFVQYEIVKAMKYRELSFICKEPKSATRFLLAFSVDYFKKHLLRFEVLRFPYNLYQSVAILKNIPIFSYDFKKRKQDEAYKEFNKNYQNYVIGYDLFIDLDCKKDFQKGYEEAKVIKDLFEEYKVPYYVLNSSKRGFHFRIPAFYMPEIEVEKLMKMINTAIYNIKGIYNLEALDDSIVDIKRLCKVPYSYSIDGSICLPLDDRQFNEFTPPMVEMENVIRSCFVRNRGVGLRTHFLSTEELKRNVQTFLNDFQ